MTVCYYDNNHSNQALVENDKGLKGIILSLACLMQVVLPDTTISSLVKASDKRPPLSFVLQQIHKLRKELELPYIHLREYTADLEGYTNEIYKIVCAVRRDIRPIRNIPEEKESLPVILTALEEQGSDLGPIDWWDVKSIDFAIILGCRLGDGRWYACPKSARLNMLEIGTGIARGLFQSPHTPHPPDNNMEDQLWSSCNVQTEPENDDPSRGPWTTALPSALLRPILCVPPGPLPGH